MASTCSTRRSPRARSMHGSTHGWKRSAARRASCTGPVRWAGRSTTSPALPTCRATKARWQASLGSNDDATPAVGGNVRVGGDGVPQALALDASLRDSGSWVDRQQREALAVAGSLAGAVHAAAAAHAGAGIPGRGQPAPVLGHAGAAAGERPPVGAGTDGGPQLQRVRRLLRAGGAVGTFAAGLVAARGRPPAQYRLPLRCPARLPQRGELPAHRRQRRGGAFGCVPATA